jgi:hypothetical protein
VYTDGPGADSESPNLLTATVLMEQAVKTVAAPAVSKTSRIRKQRDAGSANVLSGYDETGVHANVATSGPWSLEPTSRWTAHDAARRASGSETTT